MFLPLCRNIGTNCLKYIATSTPVERFFSQGRHLLVFTRNRLSGDSIRKFLCFGAWSKRDLIRTEQVVEAVKKVMGDRACNELKRIAPVDDKEEGTSKKARSN
ncbi:hypothetical protein K438DRAFT_1570283 [Mycena galopus ATCC 62051]|nr:hypothetical protein K438DRAFT_1570283 [Mycena galopus ATCC 62051]